MSEPGVETWRTIPQPPRGAGRGSVLVHIYPPGPGLGSCYTLTGQPVTLGRGSDCDVRVNEGSVSRRHAVVEPDGDGYRVRDLQSTNGTFVNDLATPAGRLADGDYLRVGNCIYRYLTGDNVEAAYHEEIYRLIIIDALTEVPNKRYFMEFLDRELARTARCHRPLSLVLLDLDRFKSVNDDLGHLAGDYALRELSHVVRGVVRKEELFARYGGEEFVLVLPETSTEQAAVVAERIRSLVRQHPFAFEGKPFPLSVSLGVATTTATPTVSADEFIAQADARLYEAKRQGRDRVVAG
jgi:diguanylate cyclase (GGDEF)-like protein